MANDSGSQDGRDWDTILAAFNRSGAGRPAESPAESWGAPGPGPSSQGGQAPSTDLLAHLTQQLLQQQQQPQPHVYQGYSPEYVALLQQASTQAMQIQHLQQLYGHTPPPFGPQSTLQHTQSQQTRLKAQSQNNSPSSQPRSARGSISATPGGTPSATPSMGTPIAPAPPSFSGGPSLAPTPTGRPPPIGPTAEPSAGPSTGAPTPDGPDDVEDKRVRNTLASARFRAKKKAHVENVERSIRALEAQHSELEVQVADLRKENGLLKEMVQLKYGGVKNG